MPTGVAAATAAAFHTFRGLPSVMDEKKKRNKIDNLLKKLKRKGKIDNNSHGNVSCWYLSGE